MSEQIDLALELDALYLFYIAIGRYIKEVNKSLTQQYKVLILIFF